MNQQRLIALAERARNVEGSENWKVRLITRKGQTLFMHKGHLGLWYSGGLYGGIPDLADFWCENHGPLLPHDPLDPMNPAACLERAGVSAWKKSLALVDRRMWFAMDEQDKLFGKNGYGVFNYADYMEALLNLHDLAKDQGGEYQQAWERAMNPKGE